MLARIKTEVAAEQFYMQNFANDGQRFVAWYLRRVLLRDRVSVRDDITDGAHDKQIDAIIVDDDERRVLVVQGKFIEAGTIDGEPLREVLGAWARLHDLEALQADCNEKLKLKLEAVRRAFEDEYRVDFELVTTGALTEAAEGDLEAFRKQLEEGEVFAATLTLVDTPLLETRLAEAEAQELPILQHVLSVEPERTLVTQLGDTQTVVTLLPLTECLSFPGIQDGRLFRKNVRQSLGPSNRVNRELKGTINGERVRDFFFYHNGITALCDSLSVSEDRKQVTVKGLSVVNGCQSLSTIFSVSQRVRSREARDAYVLFRLYEAPERSFADRISVNTNSQSAVKPRDLRSNDKIMVGLKRAFESRYPDGYFITKRGESRPADRDERRTIDCAVLAKALIAWQCQRPNISYNEKKLFDEHYKTLFRPGYDPASMLALKAWLDAIDEVWGSLPLNDTLKAGRSYVKFHVLFAVSAIFAAANKQVGKVVEPSLTANSVAMAGLVLPMAANCLENAMQSALQQAQASQKVFSPQNWLKTTSSVQGETLVAQTMAGLIGSFPNAAELKAIFAVPEGGFSTRWTAD